MNDGAAALFGVAAVCAVVDWVAVARRNKALEYIFKPATIVVLIAATLVLDVDIADRRPYVVAALVFSMLGDVFLMLEDRFVPGLASFLIAHLAYIAGFLMVDGPQTDAFVGALAGAVVIGAVVAPRIVVAVRAKTPALVGPVVAYMAAITVMAAAATASGLWLAAVGAGLFYASDALIAWNRFVVPLAWAPVAIIVTYHLAQAALVASLAQIT